MGDIVIKQLIVGAIETNCYICAFEDNECIVIDPGAEPFTIINYIKNNNLKVNYIFNTHGHGDHIGANKALKEETNAPICIHANDKELLLDPMQNLSLYHAEPIISPSCNIELKETNKYSLCDKNIKIIETPGHTHGSICILIDNHLFTGDTLFKNGIGRTDFPHSSNQEMQESLNKLAKLTENYNAYPGHGELTTLRHEL